eukprot:5144709-Prymnesium_polylepis.1
MAVLRAAGVARSGARECAPAKGGGCRTDARPTGHVRRYSPRFQSAFQSAQPHCPACCTLLGPQARERRGAQCVVRGALRAAHGA